VGSTTVRAAACHHPPSPPEREGVQQQPQPYLSGVSYFHHGPSLDPAASHILLQYIACIAERSWGQPCAKASAYARTELQAPY
jgi:hypothetical protein